MEPMALKPHFLPPMIDTSMSTVETFLRMSEIHPHLLSNPVSVTTMKRIVDYHHLPKDHEFRKKLQAATNKILPFKESSVS